MENTMKIDWVALHDHYLLRRYCSVQAREQWQWQWREGDRFDIYFDSRIDRTW